MCQGRTYLKGIMSNGVSANTKGKVFTFLCKCWLTTWGLIVQTFISYSVQLRCSHNILHQNTRCEQALQNAPPTSLFIVCFFFFLPLPMRMKVEMEDSLSYYGMDALCIKSCFVFLVWSSLSFTFNK